MQENEVAVTISGKTSLLLDINRMQSSNTVQTLLLTLIWWFILKKMTDKAKLKDETKRSIKALLLSVPAALTIDELKRDYFSFEGDSIPFRKIGYLTLEDFLNDIPDTVYVTWKKGVMCLSAVADESTAHIQKLVGKQKINNKNKYATLRKGGPPPQRHRSGPPRPTPTVPAFIRKNLWLLFKSYPDGLPLTHFEPAFARRFNCQLQFSRLGFSSIRDLLLSVPDIVKVQDFGGEIRVVPAGGAFQNVNRSSAGIGIIRR